ncbi:hypothetical protein DMR_09490 [Solidesulfovibrio magneticus RS-1]|uniref:Uncharacterized protein n=1 Tax=Solidesulfovibrio magneticus (strain ATCC 700980 / DSM 13731 / RS-1) TaxID=573370 RepID=C4XKP9_SOLM1|nr:hypothetical protein DMR_09490 [Solidesulfovibrio magneticus RS-1]
MAKKILPQGLDAAHPPRQEASLTYEFSVYSRPIKPSNATDFRLIRRENSTIRKPTKQYLCYFMLLAATIFWHAP